MDPLMIILLVLLVLSLGGWGYGYYAGPVGAPPAPMFNGLGLLALLLIVAAVVMLATGWRFGLEVRPPVH